MKLFVIGSLIFFAIFAFIAIRVTHMSSHRMDIIHAVFMYNLFCESNPDYDRPANTIGMEPFWKSVLRFWDWSDKNIIDADTYEKIKRYL